MKHNLSGKTLLILQGSLLAGSDLANAFRESGARVILTDNITSAFNLVQKDQLAGAVVDQGLHNKAFELCDELRDLNVPYIFSSAPHRLASMPDRQREAGHVVWRLADVIANHTESSIPRVRVNGHSTEHRRSVAA